MNMTSSLAEYPQTQETTPESQRVSGTVEGSPLAPEMLSVLCLSKLGPDHEFPYSRTHGTDIVLINCNAFTTHKEVWAREGLRRSGTGKDHFSYLGGPFFFYNGLSLNL